MGAYAWSQMVADVVPNYLTEGLRNILYRRLSLTKETFCRVIVPCMGSLMCLYSSIAPVQLLLKYRGLSWSSISVLTTVL